MKQLGLSILLLFSCSISVWAWSPINVGGGGWFERISVASDGTIYVASDLSGAYVSHNNGQSWSIIGYQQGMTSTHVAGFGMHPSDSSKFFIATEDGIFKTINAGANFSHPLTTGYVEMIAVANNTTAYAAYHSDFNTTDGSIYKTIDGGDTWTQVSTNLPNNLRIIKIIIEPNNPNHLYLISGAGRFVTGSNALYRSLDGGNSWSLISGGFSLIITDLAIDATNPQTIWVTLSYGDSDFAGELYKSTDSGNNFTHIASHGGSIWLDANNASHIRLFDSEWQFDFTDEVRDGVWESLNSGTTWQQISQAINIEQGWSKIFHIRTSPAHSVTIANNNLYWVNSQTVYASFDGGLTAQQLYSTEVSTDNWHSRGIDNAVIVELEADKSDNNYLWAGFIDMGVWRSSNQGATWMACNRVQDTGIWLGYGGNSWSIVTDSERDGYVWTMQSEDEEGASVLLHSTARGGNDCHQWMQVGNGLPAAPLLGLSIDLSQFNGNSKRTMYVTVNGDVYRSVDDGANFSNVFANGGMRVTAVSQNGIAFAGGENGIFRANDGINFSDNITLAGMAGTVSGMPFVDLWHGVSDIQPNPGINFPNRLWVVVHGVGVYKSENNGDTWQLMLADPFAWNITVSMHDDSHLFVTSSSAFDHGGYDVNSKGVWESQDSGQTWQNISDNLPWPFALDIDFSIDNDYTYVGSPGAGIYKRANFDLIFTDGFE